MFRARYLCQCLAFLIVFLPIIDLYSQFLTSSLMCNAAVTEDIMGKLDTMYDSNEDRFILSQRGMRDMCMTCYCFLNGLSVTKLQRLMTCYRKQKKSVSRKPGSGRKQSLSSVACEMWFKDLIEQWVNQLPIPRRSSCLQRRSPTSSASTSTTTLGKIFGLWVDRHFSISGIRNFRI